MAGCISSDGMEKGLCKMLRLAQEQVTPRLARLGSGVSDTVSSWDPEVGCSVFSSAKNMAYIDLVLSWLYAATLLGAEGML
eukprot:6386123-Amphidinium_carterae.1